jgi:hypothetical protein
MFKYLIFLQNIDDRISNENFGTNFYVAGSGSAYASGIRILDADPGDQNHADPCRCGSATLVRRLRGKLGHSDIPNIVPSTLRNCQTTDLAFALEPPRIPYCTIHLIANKDKKIGADFSEVK